MNRTWGFYGRKRELNGLLRALRSDQWCFGAIRGRRRVGKTELMHRALSEVRRETPDRPILYLQLVDESESGMAAPDGIGSERDGIAPARPALPPVRADPFLRSWLGVFDGTAALVAGYWNRPDRGGDIEIDFVGWNADDRRVRFGSCKRSPLAHDPASLASFRSHVSRYLETDHGSRFRDADVEYALLAPRFGAEQRAALESGRVGVPGSDGIWEDAGERGRRRVNGCFRCDPRGRRHVGRTELMHRADCLVRG